MVPRPHFLLFCDGQSPKRAVATATAGEASISVRGEWRFILEDIEAGTRLEACDAELVQAPERAALLAVVRGLEALEQPSRVTLVTTSRYVSRGLQFGLSEWRESDYCWEHFGSVQPIRNADLWRRVDHALQFHQIHCRWIAGQASESGENSTQLQIESIACTAATSGEALSDAGQSLASPRCSDPLLPTVGKEPALTGTPFRPLAGRSLRTRLLAIAPIRSLRLPSILSILRECDRHTWLGRIFARLLWSAKSSPVRKLAL